MHRTRGLGNRQAFNAFLLDAFNNARQSLHGIFLAIRIVHQQNNIVARANGYFVYGILCQLRCGIAAALCIMVIGIPVIILKAAARHLFYDGVIIAIMIELTVAAAREAESLYFIACQRINLIICRCKVLQISFRRGIDFFVLMLIGVDAQRMTFINNALNQFLIAVNFAGHDKKCCLHMMLFQDVQNLRRAGIRRTVIKGQITYLFVAELFLRCGSCCIHARIFLCVIRQRRIILNC